MARILPSQGFLLCLLFCGCPEVSEDIAPALLRLQQILQGNFSSSHVDPSGHRIASPKIAIQAQPWRSGAQERGTCQGMAAILMPGLTNRIHGTLQDAQGICGVILVFHLKGFQEFGSAAQTGALNLMLDGLLTLLLFHHARFHGRQCLPTHLRRIFPSGPHGTALRVSLEELGFTHQSSFHLGGTKGITCLPQLTVTCDHLGWAADDLPGAVFGLIQPSFNLTWPCR